MAARQGELLFENRTKLRGDFPDLALPDDIRSGIEMLAESERVFLTLPIMKVGSRSRNQRTYSRAAVEAIMRAINENHTTGITGHLKDEDYSFAFDFPTLRWLRAEMQGNTLWGKCLVCTPDAREYIRFAKATNAVIGTSIYGWLTFAEGTDTVIDVELESLDLVDPVRVGVLDAVAQPVVSKEMHEGGDMPTVEEMSRQLSEANTRIAELEAAQTAIQSAEYRAWGVVYAEISASLGPDTDAATYIQEMYAAMRQVQEKLGIDGAGIVVRIDEFLLQAQEMTGMRAELAALRGESLKRGIESAVADAVPSALPEMREWVLQMVGGAESVDAAKQQITRVMEMPLYEKMAKALALEAAGPSAIVAQAAKEADAVEKKNAAAKEAADAQQKRIGTAKP